MAYRNQPIGPGIPRLANVPLTQAAVFAVAGHSSTDLVSRAAATVNTGASRDMNESGRCWRFSGTTPASLNFGSVVATRNLDVDTTGATWAFWARSPAVANLALADQSGGGGWSIQVRDAHIAFSAYRPTTDLTKEISETIPASSPFTLIVTNSGAAGDLAASFNIYVNGILGTVSSSTDGAGVRPSESNNLNIGEAVSGFPNTVMTGDVMVGLILARQWSTAQIWSFARNPLQVFWQGER